jgi:hypothetical protein
MSIADVRAAFIHAGAGDLALHDATMRHVGDGAHVLQFIGAHRDGTRFEHVSPPFHGDPDQRARDIAKELIAAELVAARAAAAAPKIGQETNQVTNQTINQTTNQQEDKPMPAPAPISGLASTLRDHLTQATARADAVARRAKDSVSNLHQVLDAAEGTVQQLDAAASDIQAALGLSTNGGPPLEADTGSAPKAHPMPSTPAG